MAPSIRVLALDTRLTHIQTVNVVASAQNGAKAYSQLTANQAKTGVHRTVMPSASTLKHVPTIFISGYSGPN